MSFSFDSNQINSSYFYWLRKTKLKGKMDDKLNTLSINLQNKPFSGNVRYY